MGAAPSTDSEIDGVGPDLHSHNYSTMQKQIDICTSPDSWLQLKSH